MLLLSYTAVPTIFPPEDPRNEKKKQYLNYAVVQQIYTIIIIKTIIQLYNFYYHNIYNYQKQIYTIIMSTIVIIFEHFNHFILAFHQCFPEER